MDKVQPFPPQDLPVRSPEATPVFSEEPKWALKSKGFVGPLFIVLGMLLKLAGVEFDIDALQTILELVLNDGTITVAALLSLIGRYWADRKIVLWPKS